MTTGKRAPASRPVPIPASARLPGAARRSRRPRAARRVRARRGERAPAAATAAPRRPHPAPAAQARAPSPTPGLPSSTPSSVSAHAADSATAPGAVIAGHRIVSDPRARELGRRVPGGGSRRHARGAAGSSGPRAAARRSRGSSTRAERLDGLSHPALARVTGFGEAPEGLWVATRRGRGRDACAALIDQGIAPMRSVRLLGEVADGIDAAHRAGVAHGDVRAENVIVRGRPVEHAVLTGFPRRTRTAREPRRTTSPRSRRCCASACRTSRPRPPGDADATAADVVRRRRARAALPEAPGAATAASRGRARRTPAPPEARSAVACAERSGSPAALLRDRRGRGRRLRAERDVRRARARRRPEHGLRGPAARSPCRRAGNAHPPSTGSAQLRDEVTLRRVARRRARSRRASRRDRGAVLDPSRLVEDIAGRAPRPRRVDLGALQRAALRRARGADRRCSTWPPHRGARRPSCAREAPWSEAVRPGRRRPRPARRPPLRPRRGHRLEEPPRARDAAPARSARARPAAAAGRGHARRARPTPPSGIARAARRGGARGPPARRAAAGRRRPPPGARAAARRRPRLPVAGARRGRGRRGRLRARAGAASAAPTAACGSRCSRSEHLRGDPLGGVGPGHRPRGLRHRAHPLGRAQQRAHLAGQPRAVELVVGHHHRGARAPPCGGRSRSGGRPWRAGRGRGSTGRPAAATSSTEPPARATTRSAAARASANGST